MTTYFEHQGALYEYKIGGFDCRKCAFNADDPDEETAGCLASQETQACHTPNGVWELVGTREEHGSNKACSDCLHVGKTFAEAPCHQCRGSVDVPVGYAPKWEPRSVLAAKPAGPVTVQLMKRETTPPAPPGEGWRTNSGSMMPAGHHDFCEVQFRDGGGGGGKVGDLAWDHHGLASDIIRFRVVSEPARNRRPPVAAQPLTTTPVVPQEALKVSDKPEVVTDPKDFGPGKVMFFHSEVTAQELGAKPTNPKDLIGVRKVPMSAVPAGVLMDLALALHEGAVKYGRHNYRGVGVRASVYYDAGIGHLMDWWEGDDVDTESGLSHVTKAIASLVVLRDAMLQDKLTDDRPPRSKVFKRDFNQLAGEIIDRHADKSPRHWTIADTEIPTKP